MSIDGRSIYGYFSSLNDAEKARERLIAAGFVHAVISASHRADAASPGGGLGSYPYGDAGDLSNLMSGAEPLSEVGNILLGAAPASGLHAGASAQAGPEWLVMAVTDGSDTEVERAVQIIKQFGGDV